jgi:branched-chain amino acid transport system substrate-binding protein
LSAIKLLHQINKKYHPEIDKRSCRYIQGYISARILLEAIDRAGDNLTGENIKRKLESLHNFDTEASFNRVTYTERIHKASSSIMIYTLMNGKLVPSSQLLISIGQKIWEEY